MRSHQTMLRDFNINEVLLPAQESEKNKKKDEEARSQEKNTSQWL
jgi:hypothetical protein